MEGSTSRSRNCLQVPRVMVFRAFICGMTQLECHVVETVIPQSYPAQLPLHFILISPVFGVHEDMSGHQVKVGRDGEDVDIVDQGHSWDILNFGTQGVQSMCSGTPPSRIFTDFNTNRQKLMTMSNAMPMESMGSISTQSVPRS